MARARNIKPGFFRNEDLVELPFSTRLLFIGLWTLADREGRQEDRPKRIKMEVFPADDVDVDAGLNQLHDKGLIVRYEVDGQRYINIPAFLKHQTPHCKEGPSTIPAPDKHSASTVQAPDKHSASTRLGDDVHPLNPDSGFLNPESLNPPPPVSDAPAKKPRSPTFDGQGWLTDRFVPPQVAADWLTLRRGKKALPTETAFRQVEAEAAKAGMPLADAVAMCCLRGWVGFKAEWAANQQGAPPGNRPPNLTEIRRATTAALTRTTSDERHHPTAERDITGESRVVS